MPGGGRSRLIFGHRRSTAFRPGTNMYLASLEVRPRAVLDWGLILRRAPFRHPYFDPTRVREATRVSSSWRGFPPEGEGTSSQAGGFPWWLRSAHRGTGVAGPLDLYLNARTCRRTQSLRALVIAWTWNVSVLTFLDNCHRTTASECVVRT